VERISGSEDLFVSSLTEEEVLELTVQDACLRRCASRFEVRQ
jgi:hypothetical protein